MTGGNVLNFGIFQMKMCIVKYNDRNHCYRGKILLNISFRSSVLFVDVKMKPDYCWYDERKPNLFTGGMITLVPLWFIHSAITETNPWRISAPLALEPTTSPASPAPAQVNRWALVTQLRGPDLSAKKSSLNDWNISDAPPDKRREGVEWETRELLVTLWSTRKWEGVNPALHWLHRAASQREYEGYSPLTWWQCSAPGPTSQVTTDSTVGEVDRDVKRSRKKAIKPSPLSDTESVKLLGLFIC